MPNFIPNQVYIRSSLHEQYGGQRQGGISSCPNHNMIMIFSGQSGAQYGYHDGWSDDETRFYYTGEGQIGDMAFIRGNRAIRDHVRDGRELHLFEYIDRGRVRYVGRMAIVGTHEQRGSDREGNDRNVIIFELEPYDEYQALEEVGTVDLATLRRRAIEQAVDRRPNQEARTTLRQRSLAIKTYALARARGICEGCGNPAPFITRHNMPFLEVHHLRSLSDDGPDHPIWVAATCPNCHRRAHNSMDSDEFNQDLILRVQELENQ
jgi:5-methylcytosine-specific restriction protein A